MCSLSACTTNAIPELSDEEMHQVEEYAAHLLLQYDANYEMTTVTAEEIEEHRQELERRAQVQAQIAINQALKIPEEPETPEGSGESGSGSGSEPAQVAVYTDIDDFLEEPDLEINYVGYEVCATYPQNTDTNDWQGVVRATEGSSLIVFRYTIQNTGASDVILDMAGKGAKFNFRINNSVSKPALRTLRLDEFSMFLETIPAGGSKEAVLIVEVDAATASSIEALKMTLRYGEKRSELTLL
jgi:hypothetical protein